jgi:isoprenylcysteine carboxyl methyltransferase (ICMT) family protein YpbQ
MKIQLDFWPTATAVYVLLLWFVFGAAFLFHKKPPAAQEAKKDPRSRFGIVLQGIAYALVWSLQRTHFTPIVPMPQFAEIALALATMAISTASVWISLAAVHTLGKQWSYQARLVEGHKLIVSGPYRLVRNPIYTGMFGKLLATGLAISHWIALVPAVLIFAIGTAIRIRSEEKLLHGAFGDDFAAYTRYVPAVFPRLF